MQDQLLDRFLAKVDQSGGPDTCWPWTGWTNDKGYGIFAGGEIRPSDRNRRKDVYASRWAFERFVRPLLPGELVLHECDHPPCVNWTRCLHAGTHTMNARERVTRGRDGGLKRRGEAHGRAKLTSVQVLDARRRHATGGEAIRALAREFGVSGTQMRRILTGENWNH